VVIVARLAVHANNVPEQTTAVLKLNDVTLSSGEEDELELFSNRGKLYRFDETVNQWKERGVRY